MKITSCSIPPSAWWRLLAATSLGLISLTLGASALTAQDVPAEPAEATEEDTGPKPVTSRARDTDSVSITGDGTLRLTLGAAPANAPEATVNAVNTDGYVHWSAPLRKSGDAWTAQLNNEAVEALLLSASLRAEFPGASTRGTALQLDFPRDRYTSALDAVGDMLGSDPLFFREPPDPGDAPQLAEDADTGQIGSYIAAVQRYDEELRAYYHRLIANHAGASALWTDLDTANRLPKWSASVRAAQEEAYAAILAKAEAVAAQRTQLQQQARSRVESWNAAHPDVAPVRITFGEANTPA